MWLVLFFGAGMIASSITGHPEDVVIIDDPYKGGDDILPGQLEKKINWFTTIVVQRVRPSTKVIIFIGMNIVLMKRMMIFKMNAPTNSVKIAEFALLIQTGFVVRSIIAKSVRLVWMSLPVMPVMMKVLLARTANRANLLWIIT